MPITFIMQKFTDEIQRISVSATVNILKRNDAALTFMSSETN